MADFGWGKGACKNRITKCQKKSGFTSEKRLVKKDEFQIVHLNYRVKYDNTNYQKNAHPIREIIKNTVKQSGDCRRIFIIGDHIEEKNYRFEGDKKKEKNENFDSQKKKRVINIW
jgi:hypothetical protein